MRTRTVGLRLSVWVLCAAIVGSVIWGRSPQAKYEAIAQEPRSISAKVTGKQPWDHQYIEYEFEVDGKVFRGKGYAGAGNPQFEEIRIGDPFIVTYFARDPAIAVAGEIEDRLFEASGGSVVIVVVFAVCVATMLVVGLVKRGWI